MRSPLHSRLRPCLLGLALLVAAPVGAQARPDVPDQARIRIEVLRADSSAGKKATLRGTGVVERVDGDSIAFRLDKTNELWIAPWVRVRSLEVSEGVRSITFGERVVGTAGFTFVGAALGYLTWHSCQEPEEEDTLTCVLFPRRLGTAVRGGTWLGLAVGLAAALSNVKTEEWRRVARPSLVPFVGHSNRSGVMVGVSFSF